MTQVVTDRNGRQHEFPDGVSPEEIQAALVSESGGVSPSPPQAQSGPGLVARLLQTKMIPKAFMGWMPSDAPSSLSEAIGSQFDTPENALNMLPAAGAVAAGLVAASTGPGAVPTAMAGAGGGEALRQLIRRSVGLPQATGLVQSVTGQDPNSSGAAASGIAAEAATAGISTKVGELLTKMFRAPAADVYNIKNMSGAADRIGAEPALGDVVKGTKFEPLARSAQSLGEVSVSGNAASKSAANRFVNAGYDALEGQVAGLRQTPLGSTRQVGAEMAQEGIKKGFSAAKTEESAAFNAWRAQHGSTPVPNAGQTLLDSIADTLQLPAQDKWKLLTSLKTPASQLRAELPLSGKPSAFKDLMGRVITISTKGDKVTAEEMRLLTSSLREEARSSSGLTRRLYAKTADAAESLIPADAAAALQGPKALTYNLEEVFGGLSGKTGAPTANALTTQVPERIAVTAKTGSAGELFDKALKYSEKTGGSVRGRDALVSVIIEDILPRGGHRSPQALRNVAGRLAQSAESLDHLSQGSPDAAAAIKEVRRIGELLRELQHPSNTRTGALMSALRPIGAVATLGQLEIPSYVLTKMIYSPTSRRLMISAMEAANRGELSQAAKFFGAANSASIAQERSQQNQDETRQSLGPMVQ